MAASPASILHADLDSFYASVEQRDEPDLAGRPVIVGHGVVLAASYEAKAYGVRTAMGGMQARALCPDAAVVSPRMSAYSEASDRVFEVFRDTSPLVEGLSIDEAFLDVGGLWRIAGTPTEIAQRLRARVLDDVGLPLSVGVARTKFLAKVASAVSKPDGLLVVEPDGELDFLHALPVRRLWGVGPVTGEKLESKGIDTVGDLARLHESTLISILGPAAGRHLHALAHNRDPRRIDTKRRRRSIGSQRALGQRPTSRIDAEAVLLGIIDRVTSRLRKAERVARTVTLRFRDDEFTRQTRSRTLLQATDTTDPILEAAQVLLAQHWPTVEERGLTLLGVSLTNLTRDATRQLVLPFGGRPVDLTLDRVIDDVRERYGREALSRATLLDRDEGMSVPMLPD
ncbi:MAG: DNA polymerase IV [Acidimicrobiales bacterium]